jgi:hypothetical protein
MGAATQFILLNSCERFRRWPKLQRMRLSKALALSDFPCGT